jgi:hypothetical protein
MVILELAKWTRKQAGWTTWANLHTSRHNQLHPVCPAAPIALHAGAIPLQSEVAALGAHLGSVVLRVGAAFGLAKRHAGGACDKRQFLTTMDPDVIRSIRQAALDLNRTPRISWRKPVSSGCNRRPRRARSASAGADHRSGKTAGTIKAGSQISRIRVRSVANR